MDPSAYAALFPASGSSGSSSRRAARKRRRNDDDDDDGVFVFVFVPVRTVVPLGRARRVKWFAEIAHVEDDCGARCDVPPFERIDGKKGKKTTVVCASRMERTDEPEMSGGRIRGSERGDSQLQPRGEQRAQRGQTRQRRDDWGECCERTVFSSKNEGLIDRKCLRDVQPGEEEEEEKKINVRKLVVECLVIDDDMGTMDACLARSWRLRKTRAPDATTSTKKKEDTKRTNDDGTKEKKKERKMLGK